MSLARDFLEGIRDRGDKPALVDRGEQVISYAELYERARRYASGLMRLGIGRGDRVALYAGASVEYVTAILGHYLLGAISVPINHRYREAEVSHILGDCAPAAALLDASGAAIFAGLAEAKGLATIGMDGASELRVSMAELCAPLPAAMAPLPGLHDDDSPALIIYTSGTTGKSKGAALCASAILANMKALTDLWQWTSADRLVLTLPLFHVHGLGIGIHGGLLQGVTIELWPSFAPEAVVSAIAERGGTIFMGVPTMYAMLLEHIEAHPEAADALRRGRLFTAGSAALSADHFRRFHALTGHAIVERYGMTETLITLSNPLGGERPGAVGLPVPGIEIRVVDAERGQDVGAGDIGELWVRGNSLMSGYWQNPQATAASFREGWFCTGDVVTRDEDGYVRIVGRQSVDIIKSGGFKISAREIEEVLARHQAVAEVAVFGAEDARWGQRIVAAVVLSAAGRTQERAALTEALIAHVSEHLADYKKPRQVLIVDALPKNAMGKVQKPALSKLVEAEAR